MAAIFQRWRRARLGATGLFFLVPRRSPAGTHSLVPRHKFRELAADFKFKLYAAGPPGSCSRLQVQGGNSLGQDLYFVITNFMWRRRPRESNMGIVRDFHVQVRQYSCYQKLVCILVCALVAAVGVSTDGRDFFLFMSLRRGSSKHLKGYESKDV